jgi:hypothetical protein
MADAAPEEDSTSKLRRLTAPWRDKDIHGRLLLANQIPGGIAAVQLFRGTVCSVDREPLERLINGEKSPEYLAMDQARGALVMRTAEAMRHLHWKDFETLVDLVFRQAGWRRNSVLGETMKYADLELEEPITGDRYQVQVKAKADLADYQECAAEFSSEAFRRLYFVVHSPSAPLASLSEKGKEVELVLPERLAEMVVEGGLVGWVLGKVQ